MSMDWSRVVRCRSIFLSNSFVSEKIVDLVIGKLKALFIRLKSFETSGYIILPGF